MLFLMNLLKTSLQNELDNFFKTIHNTDLPQKKVSNSALCQARTKIKHEAFVELNKKQVDYFYSKAKYKQFRGFRLIAIDGSTVVLPRNTKTIEEFGEYSHSPNNRPVVLARISHTFDVLNHISIDSCISPLKTGEHDLARQHMEQLCKGDLCLLDRGYPAFWLFKLILQKGVDFCARVNTSSWTAARELVQSGGKEKIIEIYASHKSISKCNKMGLSTAPIRCRFISIELDSGEKEVLITSLIDDAVYPYNLFKELYHQRWPVEEFYKLMKHRIELENFTGKSPEVIKQDYYARVFMANLSAILASPVHEIIDKKYQKRKYRYQINWTQAMGKMKHSAILLFIRDNIIELIKRLQQLFINNVIPIRPDRKYPRNHKPKRHFYMAYKPIS